MKLTLDQAKKIAKDYHHYHGQELDEEEGNGNLPYLLIGPYDKDTDKFKSFISVVREEMRFNDFEDFVFESSTGNYNVYVFFEDYSRDGLLIYDELKKWLSLRGENIDYEKY